MVDRPQYVRAACDPDQPHQHATSDARTQIESVMGKHEVGYARIEKDYYPTPGWVVDALSEHVDLVGKVIWEPCTGNGQMAKALLSAGAKRVFTSDIVRRDYSLDAVMDFLSPQSPKLPHFHAIITNSPFGPRNTTAVRFIERGLERIGCGQSLALLLPVDFASAKTRAHLFGDCPHFVAKIELTRRIIWFDGPDAAPKENHAWFLWTRSFLRGQRPVILHAPKEAA